MKYKIKELLKNQHVAHRGYWDNDIPENSLAAFQKALDSGFDIELDAHLMRDGNFAVFHDFTLNRMCGKSGLVSNLTAEKLKNCQLQNSTQTIPSLTEILKMVDGKVILFLEIRVIFNWKKYAIELAEAIKDYKGAIILHGLNRKVLKYLQANTKYPVAVLSLKPKVWTGDFIPDALTVKLSGLPVKESERKNYPPFISWTINNEADRNKAEAYSDAYMTNLHKIKF